MIQAISWYFCLFMFKSCHMCCLSYMFCLLSYYFDTVCCYCYWTFPNWNQSCITSYIYSYYVFRQKLFFICFCCFHPKVRVSYFQSLKAKIIQGYTCYSYVSLTSFFDSFVYTGIYISDKKYCVNYLTKCEYEEICSDSNITYIHLIQIWPNKSVDLLTIFAILLHPNFLRLRVIYSYKQVLCLK